MIVISGGKLYRGKLEQGLREEIRMKIYLFGIEIVKGMEESLCPGSCLSSVFPIQPPLDTLNETKAECKGIFGETVVQLFIKPLMIESKLQWFKLVKSAASVASLKASSTEIPRAIAESSIHHRIDSNGSENPFEISRSVKQKTQQRSNRMIEDISVEEKPLRIAGVFGGESRRGQKTSLDSKPFVAISKVEDFQNKLKEEMKRIELKYQGNQAIALKTMSQESFHETNSTITITNSNMRKKIDSLLTEWNEQSELRTSPKQSKYDTIRKLIEGQHPNSGASKQLTDRYPQSRELNSNAKNLEQKFEALDKKAKLAMIKANLNKIDSRPTDTISNKETIEYEFSDGDFSEADVLDHRLRSPTYDPELNFQKSSRNEMIEEVKEESDRNESVIYYSKGSSLKDLREHVFSHASYQAIQDDEFDYQINEIGFEEVNGPRHSRQAYQSHESQETQKHSFEDMKLFAQVLNQKVTLIMRIKRRNAWRAFIDNLISNYIQAAEEEKVEQCHEILRLLACEIKREAGLGLLRIIRKMQTIVKVEQLGIILQEKIELTQKREAFEQIYEASVEPEANNLLDSASIRKVLIIAKTIVQQKRYLALHKVFGMIRQISEDKKIQTKKMISCLLSIEKRMNKSQMKRTLGDLASVARLGRMVTAFENQIKAICMIRLNQYKQDRSFLACTASDITVVRDDSMEISKSRFDKKFILVQYLSNAPGQSRREEEKVEGLTRNKRHLHQNTLEDIRNELSHMQGRRLDDYSGFSKKSDHSKGPPQESSPKGSKIKSFSPESVEKTVDHPKPFTSERLNLLVENAGIKEGVKSGAPTPKSEASYHSSKMRSAEIQEKLIEIQLIDDDKKNGQQRGSVAANADLPPLDKFKKQFKTEEIQAKRYSFDSDAKEQSKFKQNPKLITEDVEFGAKREAPVSPKVQIHTIVFRERDSVQVEDTIADEIKSEPPAKNLIIEERKELLQADAGVGPELSLPSLIKNIKSNFTELQKIYQQGSTVIEADSDQKRKPTETSAEEFTWPDKQFQQGFNFISGNESKSRMVPNEKPECINRGNRLLSSPSQQEDNDIQFKDDSVNRETKAGPITVNQNEFEPIVDAKDTDRVENPNQEPKLPLGYTKTQLSFRSFFKKLEKPGPDNKTKPVSASMAPDKGNDSLLKLISPLKQPSFNEYSLGVFGKTQEKSAKKTTANLNKIFKTATSRTESPNFRHKSNSLVDRLQKHISSPLDSNKKPAATPKSRETSTTSVKAARALKKPTGHIDAKSRMLESKSRENFRSRISENKHSVPLQTDRKPPIKIKDSSRSRPEHSTDVKKYESERSANRPPAIPKSTPKGNPIGSQLSNQSIDAATNKKSVARLNSSMKSNRTCSAKSDSSRKLDNSNEDYRRRYDQVRGQLKASNNYVKIADVRRQYNSRGKSPGY